MAGDEYHRGNVEEVHEKASEGNYIAAIETAMEDEPHLVEYVASAAQQDPNLTDSEKQMVQDRYEELVEGTVQEHPAGPYSPEEVDERIDALVEHREYGNALRLAESRAPDKLEDVAEEAIAFYEDEDTTGDPEKANEIREQYLSDMMGRGERARQKASELRDTVGEQASEGLQTAGMYVGGVAANIEEHVESGRETLDEYLARGSDWFEDVRDREGPGVRERLDESTQGLREEASSAWDYVTNTATATLGSLFGRGNTAPEGKGGLPATTESFEGLPEPEGTGEYAGDEAEPASVEEPVEETSGLPARTEDFEGLPEPEAGPEPQESGDYISRTVDSLREKASSWKSSLF